MGWGYTPPGGGGGGGGGGVTSHGALTGRSNSNQHPISAITDLQAELDAGRELVRIEGYAEATDAAAWEAASESAKDWPEGIRILVKYDDGSAEIWTRNAATLTGPYFDSPGVVTTSANYNANVVWLPFFGVDEAIAAPKYVTTLDLSTYTLTSFGPPSLSDEHIIEVVGTQLVDTNSGLYGTVGGIADTFDSFDQMQSVQALIVDCFGEYDPGLSVQGDGPDGRPAFVCEGTRPQHNDLIFVVNAATPSNNGFWIIGAFGDPAVRPDSEYVLNVGTTGSATYADLWATGRTFDVHDPRGFIYSVRLSGVGPTDYTSFIAVYKSGISIENYAISVDASWDVTIPLWAHVVSVALNTDKTIVLLSGASDVWVYGGGGTETVTVKNDAGTTIGTLNTTEWGHFLNRSIFNAWQLVP